MGIVIGIDVGGSTTKIVGVEDKKIKNPMFVKATDPVTSLFGAFGKYIYNNNISLSNIEKVILTGVGSAYIDQPLYGLPTAKTDEFLANGPGAQYNTGLDNPLVVSMNDLCGANGCQVAIALISPDDFIRLHPLDAGSSCGSASMHWNNDIGVIQERVQTAAANGRNMNNLILQA